MSRHRLPIFHLISNADAIIVTIIVTNPVTITITNLSAGSAHAPVKPFKQLLSHRSCDRRGGRGGPPSQHNLCPLLHSPPPTAHTQTPIYLIMGTHSPSSASAPLHCTST